MFSVLVVSMVFAAEPVADPKDAWVACGRGARTAAQVQECQLAFMGKLTESKEPDSEHGKRVAAIVEARRAAAEAREAERQAQVERTKADAAAAAETQRAHEAEVDKAKQEEEETEQLLTSLEKDPKVMHFVWSTAICRWTVIRAEAKREIEQQKKYAREGAGIVDMGALYAEQQRMRRADERMDRARRELREFDKKPPLKCQDAKVLAVVACVTADWEGTELDDEGRALCNSREAVLLREVVYRSDSYLRH